MLGTSPAKARREIGLLPQSDTRNTAVPVTAWQVVSMGLYRKVGIRRFTAAERARVDELLELVGLADKRKKLFGELSGGQQQRIILARALAADPKLILLDEPFNGLDRPNRDALLNTIKSLRAAGKTLMISTHDLEIAREACSHVLLLDKRMIAFGTVSECLTLQNVAATFHDTTVEIDKHTLTTRHEHATHIHREAEHSAEDAQ